MFELFVILIIIGALIYNYFIIDGTYLYKVITSLFIVSLVFVGIISTNYYQFFNKTVLLVLIILNSISLIGIYVLNLKGLFDLTKEHLFILLRYFYNTVLGVLLLVYVPFSIFIFLGDMVLVIGVIVGYYIILFLYNRFTKVIPRDFGLYIFLIVIIYSISTFIGYSKNREYIDVLEHFNIPFEVLKTDVEYDVLGQFNEDEVDFNHFLDHYSIQQKDDKVYIINFHAPAIIDDYDHHNYLFVYSITTGEVEYNDLIDTSGEHIFMSDNSKRDIYFMDDKVIIVTRSGVFEYINNDVVKIFTGDNIVGFEDNGVLTIFHDDIAYRYINNTFEETTDFDIYEDKGYQIVNDTIYQAVRVLNYNYIIVDDEYIYVDEFFYMNDDLIVTGEYSDIFHVVDDKLIPINNIIDKTTIICGDSNYTQWRPSWIINDFPSSIIMQVNNELEITNAYMAGSTQLLYCNDDELYGLVYSQNDDFGYSYEIVKFIDSTNTSNYFYSEFAFFIGNRSLLMAGLVVFRFSRKDGSNELKLDKSNSKE